MATTLSGAVMNKYPRNPPARAAGLLGEPKAKPTAQAGGRAGRFGFCLGCRFLSVRLRARRVDRRIQVFDGEGNFQRRFTIDVPVPPGARPAIGYVPDEAAIAAGTFAPGSPWAICISPGPNQVLYSSDGFPGRIYKLSLDGEVLGVLGESGKQLKQFGWIHEMACPSENVLFVAELLNWRVQKLVLHS